MKGPIFTLGERVMLVIAGAVTILIIGIRSSWDWSATIVVALAWSALVMILGGWVDEEPIPERFTVEHHNGARVGEYATPAEAKAAFDAYALGFNDGYNARDSRPLTMDPTTNRIRTMTDREIDALRDSAIPPTQNPPKVPLDDDESAYDPHIGSMIDPSVGEY